MKLNFIFTKLMFMGNNLFTSYIFLVLIVLFEV